ncbi:putative membrane protein, partial [Vibrio harveyi]|jgi:hypothetical protein
LGT